MRIKWWKRNDPRGIIAALVAGPLIAGIWLAGCGGGGGGSSMTTPTGFLLNGTVYAPNRTLTSVAPVVATRQNAAYGPVSNVTVAVGRVDNTGAGFAPLAQTTTDSLGGFTFTLPPGVLPAPNLLVRATSGSTLLENIVTGPTVNISPETTAATELLFSTAQNQGIGLGRLRVGSIASFVAQATAIADNALPGTNVARAIANASAAFQSKRYAATIANALTAVLTDAAPPPTITPGGPRRTPSRTPAPTPGGGGTPGATATSSGPPGPPGPPGGRPTPTPIRRPGGQPTPVPTTSVTEQPTTQPTTGPTSAPGVTPTPRPTAQPTIFGPTVTPGPQITPVTTPTPGAGVTPTPNIASTPILRAGRARRGR